ncbi:hypothetical protein GQ53DRAFT_819085 [Thozetella sp. PMI_491]|nr:hypothetical protein GQ53DRAFT_819085 [Thozetella sp. PMI_491]
MKNEHEDLAIARRVLDNILDKYDCHLPSEDVTILLKHGRTLEESVGITMNRESDPNDGSPLFRPMLNNLTSVYGFGGLSECGKSTLAEAFCARFRTKQAFRAKIVYFNSLIGERLGLSIYDAFEKIQALHLFHEIERFQRSHYWLRLLTLESLHRDSVAQHLKLWLGEKFQIVFINTGDTERRERSLVSM